MKNILVILSIITIILNFSCTKTEDIIAPTGNGLSFSSDTVIFDTVFTDILTVTKRLTVFNNNDNAINIDDIFLNPNSPYSIIINGEETNSAKNLVIKGNDKILILVKAVLGKNNANGFFIVEDSIQFVSGGVTSAVKLVSWGRDAYFHSYELIGQDQFWPNDKPHIIYGVVVVGAGATLTIEAGTEIYIHGGFPFEFCLDSLCTARVGMYGPGMVVGGTLLVNGTATQKVIFTDDRLEESYEHRPGLWGEVQFLASSNGSKINHAEFSNAAVGIRIQKGDSDDDVDLTIENTFIHDMRYFGVYSLSADVDMKNCAITNCAQNSVSCAAGGYYNFNHCTFAEYPFDFTRDEKVSTFRVTNIEEFDGYPSIESDLTLNIKNCIIWGEKGVNDETEEIQIKKNSNSKYEINLEGPNIFKTLQPEFLDDLLTITKNPKFPSRDSLDNNYNLKLTEHSPAINSGVGSSTFQDIDGNFRTDAQPDIGAYEFVK